MKGNLKVKMQTNRATTYREGITNANIIYRGFEMGLAGSGSWGDFSQENPVVTFTISGDEYECPIEKLKEIIRKNLKPTQ